MFSCASTRRTPTLGKQLQDVVVAVVVLAGCLCSDNRIESCFGYSWSEVIEKLKLLLLLCSQRL